MVTLVQVLQSLAACDLMPNFHQPTETATMELLSINHLFGFSVWAGVMEWKASDKLIDTLSTDNSREVWLFGRLHIVISKEAAAA